jgi:hypothetical protein
MRGAWLQSNEARPPNPRRPLTIQAQTKNRTMIEAMALSSKFASARTAAPALRAARLAAIPQCIREQLDRLDGIGGIVAVDNQLAFTRDALFSAVLDDQPQARARFERRREWVADDPVTSARRATCRATASP